MIDEIKILLGDEADNYTEAQIGLCLKFAIAEVEGYCNRELDYELEIVAINIAIIKLHKLGNEGVSALSLAGISETYLDDYPTEIKNILIRKRKIKII